MKKIFTLFTTLLVVSTVILPNKAQAQSSCAWAKKAGGSYEDNGTSIATDGSGNVYSLGYFYSSAITFTGTPNISLHNTYGGACMYLVKHDSCGNLQWAKQANGHDGGDVYGANLTADAAGNVYVTGYFAADTIFAGAVYAVNSSYQDVFLVKYNTSGVAQWIKQSTGNSQDKGTDIALDASGNIYLTGYYNSTTLTFGSNNVHNGTNDGFTNDMFVAKFDNSGTNLWVRGNISNSSTFGDTYGFGIGTDASGNVYVAGSFESDYIRFGTDSLGNNGYRDIYVVKYNSGGTFQWLRSAGDSDDDGANSLAADAAGNTFITGRIGGSSTVNFGTASITNAAINPTVFLAKYDANGTAQWAKTTKGDYYSYNEANSVSLDAGGNPYIIGYYSSDSLRFGGVTLFNSSIANGGAGGDYNTDIFVAKYKANGNLSWARTAGGDSNDIGNGIATGLNNSLYITGMFQSPSISFAGIPLANSTPSSNPAYGDAFIANNISTLMVTPDICMVSADSLSGGNQYNVIYWDKTSYSNAASFIIYREVTTGVYTKIGLQPYSTLSQFTDNMRSINGGGSGSNGDPTTGSQRYKLQIVDTAGTYSFLSPYHNTIFIIEGAGGVFSWTTNYAIEGQTLSPVSSYVLNCDTANTNVWTQVAAQSGSQQSIADPGFIHHSSVANWRVDALGFNCTPTLRLASGNNNGTYAAKIKSHSNQTNNRPTGIDKISNNQQVSVYPNPANTTFIVETTSVEKQQLQIVDVTGKIVLQQNITGKITIDASLLNDGVYNISIIGNGSIANKKLVIVK